MNDQVMSGDALAITYSLKCRALVPLGHCLIA